MKHFTSYYANYRNIPKDYLCIGISRTCPEWFNINQESLGNFYWVKDNVLSPPADLLDGFKNGSIDINEYKKRYIAHLFSWIEKDRMYKDIPDYMKQMDEFFSTCSTPWKGLVFMCYESPNEFCHRHLFRRLLTNIYNIECEEYGVKDSETWGYKGPKQTTTIPLFN